MLSNQYVDGYIDKWKTGELILNKKRILLLKLIEKEILPRSDLFYFDEEQINNYIEFSEAWYFELDEWEKFISAFIFLFHVEDDEVVFDEFVINMGRGGGKNGFISTLSNYFVSSLHGIDYYDVSIVANSEKQAKRSFQECYRVVNKKGNEVLKEEFEAYKSSLTGLETQSVFEYKTSNATSQDGGREGAVIYDEYHEMENTDIVDVFSGGLGKVDHGRQFFIGTKGFVREGYFDIKYRECEDVLNGLVEFKGVFPYICELDTIEEMDNPDNWPKSNPALQPPLNKRGRRLLNEVMKKYKKLATEPSGRSAFVTKRMNFLEDNMENSVATKEEMMATDREFFNLDTVPIGSLDYGDLRDFASTGLLFKNTKADEYVFKTYTFALKSFCDIHYGYSLKEEIVGSGKKAPIKNWEKMGLMKVVNEPSLNPKHVVRWFIEAREKYGMNKIVIDNYKAEFMGPALEKEGFEVIRLRKPSSLHPMLAPRVVDGFANHKFIFGNNPLMRWFTNNVFVKETKEGKFFLKKEETKRKTDGFHAFIHALYLAKELEEQFDIDESFDMLDEIEF